jgi:putative membrane protein
MIDALDRWKKSNMRLAVISTLAFALAAGVPATAAVTSDDTSFVQSAQHEALGQYALAALARSKAQNPSAKSLASQIADNATQANNFIQTYAKSHSVALDNRPSVRADNQYSNISSDKGSAFDREFASAIYIDANIALDNYKDEAAHGSDPALRAFAKKQASALEAFVKTAQKLAPH